jgi:hypothetical protein
MYGQHGIDATTRVPQTPADAIGLIRLRAQQLPALETWTGKPESPLQPQEAEAVAKMVRALPLDQASSMLAAFGELTGDQFRTGALAKQLGDKDGALGRAMMYASAQTTQGRLTAQLVLQGDQAFTRQGGDGRQDGRDRLAGDDREADPRRLLQPGGRSAVHPGGARDHRREVRAERQRRHPRGGAARDRRHRRAQRPEDPAPLRHGRGDLRQAHRRRQGGRHLRPGARRLRARRPHDDARARVRRDAAAGGADPRRAGALQRPRRHRAR